MAPKAGDNLRICYIASGTFDHVQPYLNYFKNNGWEIYFIALSPSPDRNVTTLNAWRGSEKDYKLNSKKWRYFISAIIARTLVKKIKPDIVHAHYATSGGLAALLINHPKTILTVHGSDLNVSIKSRIWKKLLKLIFSRCQYINVVSDELEEKALSLRIPKNKVKNINVGIDFEKFYFDRSMQEPAKQLKIICNRSFKPVYNHVTLLKALVILKASGIPFHVKLLGDGILKSELMKFVEENDLLLDVSFLGMIANEDQIRIFEENDIYVSPSLSDGTSLSLLEAMASGLFPIVTKIQANLSFIENEKNGLLFPIKDYKTLAECLIQAYTNYNLVIESIPTNQKKCFEMGNRKKNMEKIESLYFKMLGTH